MTVRVAIFIAALLPAVAAAQVNKCFDAAGKVVGYASECPPGTRAEPTGIRNAPSATPPASQKSLAERDADFRKRQTEKQEAGAKADKKAAEAARAKRACDDARAYLRALQDRQRITRTDPRTGERSFITDAEYPKEIAAAKQSIADNCK